MKSKLFPNCICSVFIGLWNHVLYNVGHIGHPIQWIYSLPVCWPSFVILCSINIWLELVQLTNFLPLKINHGPFFMAAWNYSDLGSFLNNYILFRPGLHYPTEFLLWRIIRIRMAAPTERSTSPTQWTGWKGRRQFMSTDVKMCLLQNPQVFSCT